jgi:hypothetical protein
MHMYLLLYTGGDMPETEDDNRSMMNAWGAWLGDIGDALVDGNPFTPQRQTSLSRRCGVRWSGRPNGVDLLADQGGVDG